MLNPQQNNLESIDRRLKHRRPHVHIPGQVCNRAVPGQFLNHPERISLTHQFSAEPPAGRVERVTPVFQIAASDRPPECPIHGTEPQRLRAITR